MSVSSLERVLRYAYSNGYTYNQWSESTKQCIQRSKEDLSQDLCDLLLKHFFSVSRLYNNLLGSYLTYSLTGETPSTTTDVIISKSKPLIDAKLFLSRLTTRELLFSFNREYNSHWAFLLHVLPTLLSRLDGDQIQDFSWAPILSKLLVALSHIVAIGLYPQRKSIQQRHRYEQTDDMDNSDSDEMMKQQTPEDDLTTSQQTPEDELSSSQQLNFSFTNSANQWANDSQMTIDPDTAFDADATQPDPFIEQQDSKKDISIDHYRDPLLQVTANTTAGNSLYNSQHQHPSQTSSLYPTSWGDSASSSVPIEHNSLELDNAISAAKIIISLIEKKGVKNMIEKFAQEQKQQHQALTLDSEDTWATCYGILIPDNSKSTKVVKTGSSSAGTHSNIYIQKLLILMERLTDRDLERRLAVHMKYHELEDEGTARAMPSAGLMGLIYHMVQIRPTLDDDELITRLVKLQAIKGSLDESFYLEIWFAALTGLREASLTTSCQDITSANTADKRNSDHGDICCNTTVTTNRLLWKNLILVKIPHLISRLQEHKECEKLSNYSLEVGWQQKSRQKKGSNAIESSLAELKTFTGLLNACSLPACCSKFYVPSSTSPTFVDRFVFYGTNNDDDDDDDDDGMMDMIDDVVSGPTKDLISPHFTKSIRMISTDDIFTSIIRSCQSYNLLRNNQVDLLLRKNNTSINTDYNNIKTELDDNEDEDDPFDSTRPAFKKYMSYSSFIGEFDDAMMNADTLDQQSGVGGQMNIMIQIDQNIEQRIHSIRANASQSSISELIHIGLISFAHWRKVVDFLLELLSDKASSREIRGLSRLCGALCDSSVAIDLILQLYPPSELLSPLEQICNEWHPTDDDMDVDDYDRRNDDIDDSGNNDMSDIQQWYFKFGKIWSFVLAVANKIDISHLIHRIFKNRNGLCYQFFVTGTIIYGVDAYDEELDAMIDRWLLAMGGDGITDDLLRTTKIQSLIRIIPSIIDRLLYIHHSGKIDLETLTGVLSYLYKPYLQLVSIHGMTQKLCDELLNGHASTALACMSYFFLDRSLPDVLLGLCANITIGSLRAWTECRRQYIKFGGNDVTQQRQGEQAISIEKALISKIGVDDEQHLASSESSAIGVTRRTLTDKTMEMFRYIVKSGRSMYMKDMDVDTKELWEPMASTKSSKLVVSHYLDLVMFQAALKMAGMHWFIRIIVDEVIEAGKSGGAVRAAELGSSLLTMPLAYHGYGDDICLSMLWCLLQDVVPSSLMACASKNTSFFQGQTLGVFVSDCLVLMYHEEGDKVDRLGCQFFEALAIDRVRGSDMLPSQKVPQVYADGSKFALWDEDVVNSAVWRGFAKGLTSNPFIKEMWPKAYVS